MGGILYPIKLLGAILAKEGQQESYNNHEYFLLWDCVHLLRAIVSPLNARQLGYNGYRISTCRYLYSYYDYPWTSRDGRVQSERIWCSIWERRQWFVFRNLQCFPRRGLRTSSNLWVYVNAWNRLETDNRCCCNYLLHIRGSLLFLGRWVWSIFENDWKFQRDWLIAGSTGTFDWWCETTKEAENRHRNQEFRYLLRKFNRVQSAKDTLVLYGWLWKKAIGASNISVWCFPHAEERG